MGGGEQPKKEEKPKEETKKPNSFADRIKNMSGSNTTTSSVPVAKTAQKPSVTKQEHPKDNNQFGDIKKTDTFNKKFIQSSKPSQVPSSFASKLTQMSEMFKNNKGRQAGGHRPSMMIGMPQSFKFGKSGPIPSKPEMDIINEEPDKMKPGYDPAANLQKTLDSVVVVKKDKKKKKKPATFNG